MAKISGRLVRLGRNPVLQSIGKYSFTNFFAKGASFLLLFIFTNPIYITPSENGLLSLFSNSLVFLMPFLSLGIVHSSSTDFFRYDKEKFSSAFTSGFIPPIFVLVLSIVLFYIFRDELNSAYGFPFMFVWIIPVITFLSFCNEQLMSLIRNNNQPNRYMAVNMSRTVLELGISAILIVFFAWRWKGRVAGIFIAYLLISLYGLYYFIRNGYLFGKVSRKSILQDIYYGGPVILLQISIFSMSASDKFFLAHVDDAQNTQVGIYSIACIYSSVITVMSTAILQYIFPKVYSLLSEKNINYKSIKRNFLLYGGLAAAGTLLVISLSPFMFKHFINPRYNEALRYLFLICMGYFLWCVSYFFYSFLLFYKDKKKIFWLSLSSMIVSLTMNYLLINRWGADGAAMSILCSYAVVLVLTMIFTRKFWSKFLFV
ncbi:MAG: polysaccharide biosynthesis C-terminal domain-containing protein [Bacteroidetes bacterium]|nr:polysaccharide biosynthesis C-terminal domain-containing protein [Bacteroidota bacterium]